MAKLRLAGILSKLYNKGRLCLRAPDGREYKMIRVLPGGIDSNLIFYQMYFTYVLLSRKDNKLYIGYTRDLSLRFSQHNQGQVQSTKHRRPLELIYYEACLNKWDALHREKYFKTHYDRMFLKKRLKEWHNAIR